MIRPRDVAALAAMVLGATRPAHAQQPTQRQMDSLTAQVQALKLRLDSLRAALKGVASRGPAAAPADTSQDLAALRAAAAAAVGRSDTTTRTDTASRAQSVGRQQSQTQHNPEISVTGDLRRYGQQPGAPHGNCAPRESAVG